LQRPTTRILIANPLPLTRLGIKALFATDPSIVLAGEASDWSELMTACTDLQPDLVLIDAQLPGAEGLDASTELRSASPRTRAIVLPRDSDWAELQAAIQAVVAGGPIRAPSPAQAQRSAQRLSERELEVLWLVARGATNRQIAAALTITPNTVKVHIAHILEKLGVKDRTAAAVLAMTRWPAPNA
jgi:DNA-binding NarL/FixJ family response regulator